MNPRKSVKRMILLVFLQGAAVLLFCSWYAQLGPHDSGENQERHKRKVHVLLLSSWRSGSSFLGQVFSQHPSVFYLMEPAWHVWTKVQKPRARLLRMDVRDLLQSLYQCNFSVMDSYLPEKNVSSLFMWTESRALCSQPACPITAQNATHCRQKCDAQGLQKVEQACSSYSHVVLKETRLLELESLYPLLRDPNLDLRIVHLVRDPRAVFKSREKSAQSFGLDNAAVLEQRSITAAERQYEVMKEICSGHVHIIERAIQNPPPFLKDRYKVVRYEDVARNPLKQAKEIYEFVGLMMTKQLEGWIFNKTHGKGKGKAKEAFQVTSRNAAQVSQAWRTMLPYYKVRRVQKVCGEAMTLLGYRTVNNVKEQRRRDIDLLVSQEPYQFSWDTDTTQIKRSMKVQIKT